MARTASQTDKEAAPSPEEDTPTSTTSQDAVPKEELPPLAQPQGVDDANFANADKVTVRTTGQFMLLDIFSGKEIFPDKDSTVPRTAFIDEAFERKQIKEV